MSTPKTSPGDEQRQERFRQATVATLRAMGGAPEQGVDFQGAVNGGRKDAAQVGNVELPYLSRHMHDWEIRKIRGAADAAALKMRYHTDRTTNTPAEPLARQAFDALEQARCEVYGSRHMAGVRANLEQRVAQQCAELGCNRMKTREDMPAPVALDLLAREAMSGHPMPVQAGTALDEWRASLTPSARAALADMARTQSDQTAFARATTRFLGACELTIVPDEEDEQTAPSDLPSDEEETTDSEAPETEGQDQQAPAATEEEDGYQPESGETGLSGDSEATDAAEMSEDGTEEAAGPSDQQAETGPSETPSTYRTYTTDFDEEVNASDLCDADELERLRQKLDQQMSQLHGLVSRLAHRLQRRLMAQQQRRWEFEQEEGILDAGRLSRVVTNPTLPLSCKHECETEFRDTVVTLLIDNSGSMRGRPIATAAICGDILARTLERCGVKVEVLGFTTRQWKGGQSRERWLKADRPSEPGRLNDLRHIIYKDADTPLRRARRNLGLMLRDGLLKENIDGEALLWAWKRLRRRAEHRHILMVISDGAPVDDSTFSANPHNYLEDHLRQVIARIEADRGTELLAIGIGHDVTRYYRNSVTITSAEDLGGTMMAQLSALFAPATGRPARR
ncbi:cobaltochelatase CobT-related protein [Gluconobacter kanchanaburiensis]|uniref:Cobaltochelatase subunit CobT n=1 Tax=Gluconobacter kanchanaburiensis NBRC 103587 TaxID=1307948 RepID=A0A511B8H3_9PROT|nr:cobaltochelatase subunit CobT [Gluconobacter kanchanaburiensis]MBF0861179.1 cobaltochelatase subunit CobT [Gluconobacter kanchanaburiensis]GBR70822.1 cobalamin biosynthesis protein CobT [Gluconobacter kanchanaburiensis NBRC 103587]GEK96001.1 cobaltochelatase subunit CobT [Gluconobacter kanchanaburiensis NBRC 103587]